ncbi:hypothetical protein ABZP36_016525 [Zizania latifolia]
MVLEQDPEAVNSPHALLASRAVGNRKRLRACSAWPTRLRRRMAYPSCKPGGFTSVGHPGPGTRALHAAPSVRGDRIVAIALTLADKSHLPTNAQELLSNISILEDAITKLEDEMAPRPAFSQSPSAASFDVLPFHKSNDSLASRKELEDLASQSESNAKSEDGENDGIAYTLHQRVLELEDELNTATREKLQSSQEEINNLKNSLGLKISLEVLSEEHSRPLGQNKNPEAEIANLKEGFASNKQQFEDKLSQRDAEIVNCRQEFSDASEKLLQEKSTNSTVTLDLQETIESIRVKLAQVSDEKLLVETKFKQLEEETCGSEKYNQELSNSIEGFSEEKFRYEAKIFTLHQAIENLESKFESILEIWLAFCGYKHIYGHDYNRDRFGVRGKPPPLFIYGMNTCNGDYSKPASFEEMEKFDVDSSTLHPILPKCCVIKSDMEIARI